GGGGGGGRGGGRGGGGGGGGGLPLEERLPVERNRSRVEQRQRQVGLAGEAVDLLDDGLHAADVAGDGLRAPGVRAHDLQRRDEERARRHHPPGGRMHVLRRDLGPFVVFPAEAAGRVDS